MKSILFLLFLVSATLSAYGQGSVGFANNSNSRVYLVDATGGIWQSATFLPAGLRFNAELVFAPDGTPTDAFYGAATRLGAPVTFYFAGLFNGGGRTAAGVVPPGGFGLFQVRVWETGLGAVDYNSAVASGTGRTGYSHILRVDTGDPTTVPPGTPTPLTSAGLTSFCVGPLGFGGPCIIPEPSFLSLAALAAFAMLTFRKRS